MHRYREFGLTSEQDEVLRRAFRDGFKRTGLSFAQFLDALAWYRDHARPAGDETQLADAFTQFRAARRSCAGGRRRAAAKGERGSAADRGDRGIASRSERRRTAPLLGRRRTAHRLCPRTGARAWRHRRRRWRKHAIIAGNVAGRRHRNGGCLTRNPCSGTADIRPAEHASSHCPIARPRGIDPTRRDRGPLVPGRGRILL